MRFLRDDEDKPAFQFDLEKAQNARPLFNPRRQHGRPIGIIIALGLTGVAVFYFSNLEEVPVTGRKRFNCFSPETVAKGGLEAYRLILLQNAGKILPRSDRRVQQVERVLSRLLPISGMNQDATWEVHVINEPQTRNAFVLPGNKVFVYSGILPVCANDEGLAAVLAHEIAHNVASHAAERMSQSVLFTGGVYILVAFDITGFFGQFLAQLALDYGIMRPASRKQESEADYIGLLMMAKACYNPSAAVQMWERMKSLEQAQDERVPEFMSTHPSNENRISRLEGALAEARDAYEQSGCSTAAGFWSMTTNPSVNIVGSNEFVEDDSSHGNDGDRWA